MRLYTLCTIRVRLSVPSSKNESPSYGVRQSRGRAQRGDHGQLSTDGRLVLCNAEQYAAGGDRALEFSCDSGRTPPTATPTATRTRCVAEQSHRHVIESQGNAAPSINSALQRIQTMSVILSEDEQDAQEL